MKRANKILSVLLAVLMMFSIIPMANIEAEAITYSGSSSYMSSKYYKQLCNVTLTGNQREDIINVALSQLGYREGNSTNDYSGADDGSYNNYTEYNYWYNKNVSSGMPVGGSGAPWCATFVSWCAEQANIPSSIIRRSTRAGHGASCFNVNFYSGSSTLASSSDNDKYFQGYNYTPKKGDLFFTRSWSHVGLVVSVSGSNVITIEGNTNNNGSSQGNGVYKLTSRKIADLYFGVPNYKTTETHKVDSSYGKNFTAYPKAKITASNIFDANHNQISSTAWIGTSDKCTIHEVYTDGCCKVTYPLDDGGTKTVYSKISLFKVNNTLSIKYDANGGKIDASNEKYYLNSSDVVCKVSTSKVFAQEMVDGKTYDSGLYNYTTFGISRTGYTFKGWGTKASGGTIYNQNDAMTAKKLCSTIADGDKTITLYAIWEPNVLSVYFNANGGTITSDTYSVSGNVIYKNGAKCVQDWIYNSAEKNGLPNVATFGLAKKGYTFAGWGTKSTGGTIFDQNDTGLLPTEINSNLKNGNCSTTVYAIWKANTYTVKYNANGGTGTVSNSSHTYDTAKVLNANNFTRTGYTFLGWNTSSTATTATYTDKQSVKNLTSTNGGTVTLYAVWSKNEHTPGAWTTSTPATCYMPGVETQKCLVCGEIVAIRETPMLEHTPGEWVIIEKETCTAEGLRQKSCTVCGEVIDTEEIPATGHTAGSWEVIDEATCITEGFKRQNCTVCQDVINTEEIPVKDHSLGEWITAIEPTCEAAGIKVQYCVDCGIGITNEEIPATGHNAGAWETVTESGCISAGSKVQKCTICEKVLATEGTSSVGHKASEWIIVREATCATVGERQKICTVCDEILETEEIPVTDHIVGEWEIIENSSCNEKGIKAQSCTVCGTTLATEEIDATEHVKGDWEIVTQPTCTLSGLRVQHCTECGETISTEEIATINHIEGAWKVAIHSTCSTVGFKIKQCTECGEVLKTEEIPAKEHTFENGLCLVCRETDPSYVPDIPEEFVFSIQAPSRTEIRNKDGIILHTNIDGELPEGSRVEWSWDNSKFDVEKNDDGTLTIIAENNGYTTFTATVYDTDGNVLATDSIEMRSKSGFFDKIGGFFRSLFGSDRIYEY